MEVPVFATRGRLQTTVVGELPMSVTPLTQLSCQLERMTVRACMEGDARLVYQAIAHDPLTSAMLSLQEIKSMVQDMFDACEGYLPTFKHTRI